MTHCYTFKSSIVKLCLILTFLLYLSATGWCTTYYVSQKSGNDNLAGTSLNAAWKTIKKANKTVKPGDVVYIRGGVYKEIIRPDRSGAAENYITYAAYQKEEVIITDVHFGADLSNRSYIKVDGFKIIAVTGSWIYLAPHGTHNIIQNCYMEGAGEYQGIRLTDASNYNKILNNELRAVCYGNNPKEAKGGPNDLITCFNSSYNVFEGNKFYGGIHNGINIQERGKPTSHNVIRNNYFECRWHGAVDLFHDPEFILVEGNTIVDTGEDNTTNWCGTVKDREDIPRENKRGIKGGTKFSIIRNNILINNGHAISNRGDKAADTSPEMNRVYNNTLNRNYQGGWISDESGKYSKNNSWKNNIFSNNRDVEIRISLVNPASTGNEIINNNISGAGARKESVAGFAWKDNLDLNPKFVNENKRDLQLATGSPMIDAGAFLTKTSTEGEGKVMKVEDVYFFTDGWGIIEGDEIQLEGQTTTARIIKIDYAGKTITLDQSLTWIKAQGISLAHKGLLPDIGAYEYKGTNGTSTPGAPANLEATGISSSQIKLQWTDKSGNESGFVIERATGSNGQFVQIATVKKNETSYTNNYINAGTAYSYRVRAVNVAGISSPSNIAASKSGNGQKDEDNLLFPEADVHVNAHYNSQNYGNSGLMEVRDLSNKDWHREIYMRFDLSKESGNVKSAKLIMYVAKTSAPVNHRVAFMSNDAWSEGEVTWNNHPQAESGFLAEQKITSTGKVEFDITDKVKAELGKKMSLKLYAAENVAPWVGYGSRESSVIENRPVLKITYGDGKSPSPKPEPETKPNPGGVPVAPVNLRASQTSGPNVNLLWDDRAENEDKFLVERTDGNGGGFKKIATLAANTTTYTDGNVSTGKTYLYRIKVANTAGRDWSKKISITIGEDSNDDEEDKRSPSPPPASQLSVTRFILYNTETNKPVPGYDNITTDVTVDYNKIGTRKVNVVAITNPATAGSVWFKLNGKSERVEGAEPYALAGDSKGKYNAWSPGTTSVNVTAIPYAKSNKKGEEGQALTITLKFVNDANARTVNESILSKASESADTAANNLSLKLPKHGENNKVYPNPAKNLLNIYSIHKGTAFLYDANGRKIKQLPLNDAGTVVVWDVSELQTGVYVLKIISPERITTQQLIIEP